MAKHFDLDIADTAFSFARKTAEIAAEAATDGVYVIRTSLPAESFDDAATVRSYKSLACVERAFRCIKTVDLHVRPVLSPAGRSGPRACLPLHAGLLPGMAHASAPRADAVRRYRQGSRRSIARKRGGTGAALTGRGSPSRQRDRPRTGCRSTASTRCWPIWRPLVRNTVITAITPQLSTHRGDQANTIQHKAFATPRRQL